MSNKMFLLQRDVQNLAHFSSIVSFKISHTNKKTLYLYDQVRCSCIEKPVAITDRTFRNNINNAFNLVFHMMLYGKHNIKIILIKYEFEKLAHSGTPVASYPVCYNRIIIYYIYSYTIFRRRSSRQFLPSWPSRSPEQIKLHSI